MLNHPPLPSAFDMVIVAPSADPFLQRWLPPGPRRNQPIVVGSGYSQVRALRAMTMQTGYSLHSGDQTENPQPVGVWHHVSISALETFQPPGTTIDGLNLVGLPDIGNQSSLLKARIKLSMGNARARTFDFDIGAGVEFKVRAYAVLGIDALVPDPEGGGVAPEDVSANPRALATFVTTAVYCSASNSTEKNPLTYSQVFLLADNQVTMPVVAGARQVQFFATEDTTVEFSYVFENPIVASSVYPTGRVIISSVLVESGIPSPILFIPVNVNAFTVPNGSGQLNIVQILNA
jgi:hypothetical protein